MNELTIFTRIRNKHDSQQNWDSSTFIPQQGELIVYDSDDSQAAPKIKVGDGVRTASELPFTTNIFIQETQPTNAPVYSMWIDTSNNVLKFKHTDDSWKTTALEEALKQALTQDAVVLSEAEKYMDSVREDIMSQASSQDAVVLSEAEKYMDSIREDIMSQVSDQDAVVLSEAQKYASGINEETNTVILAQAEQLLDVQNNVENLTNNVYDKTQTESLIQTAKEELQGQIEQVETDAKNREVTILSESQRYTDEEVAQAIEAAISEANSWGRF